MSISFKYSHCWQRSGKLITCCLCFLRAPEVSLGLPITEAVDMWGVGCTLAYLFLGEHLFSTKSMFQMVCWKTSDTRLWESLLKSNYIHVFNCRWTAWFKCWGSLMTSSSTVLCTLTGSSRWCTNTGCSPGSYWYSSVLPTSWQFFFVNWLLCKYQI